MKRFFLEFAVGMGLAVVVQVTFPARSQDLASQDLAALGKGAYRLMFYCWRLSGQDNCTELQDANEHELESISGMVDTVGPSGVEIKACEWTAFSCISNPVEDFRAVTRNIVETALTMQMAGKTRSDGLTVEQPTQPLKSDASSPTKPPSLFPEH
jgi:hypothetical protein